MNMQVSAGVAKDEIVNLVWTELVSNCLGCVINTFHQSFVFWKRQVSNLFDMTVSDQNDSSGMRLVAMKIQSSTGKCANFYQIRPQVLSAAEFTAFSHGSSPQLSGLYAFST